MTPDRFNKRMKEIGNLIQANAVAGLRASALIVDQVVVLATPVDTGRARANWIATVDRASFLTKDSVNWQTALNEAQSTISKALPTADAIYISNNLDYIGSLNEGSSAQAPAGFVEKAVQLGLIEASKIRLLRGA